MDFSAYYSVAGGGDEDDAVHVMLWIVRKGFRVSDKTLALNDINKTPGGQTTHEQLSNKLSQSTHTCYGNRA